MNDSPNGTLPPPATALHLMALLDALDPPITPGEAREAQGSDRSYKSYLSYGSYPIADSDGSHETDRTNRTHRTHETTDTDASPRDERLSADLALASALVAGRRTPPSALLGRRFVPGVGSRAVGASAYEVPGDPVRDAAGLDPALTPPGRRGRWLELAVAATVILAGAWLFQQGPGRRPPAAKPGHAVGIGADAATMPAGLVPQSAEIQLRLLDQLGGPVTLQAVDAAGHLAVMRGRRLELYQLTEDRPDAPRLLGRSDIIETPILDLALAGERALLLEDEHPATQGLIEIDLGPGFRAGEMAAEVAHLPQVRRRKVDGRPPAPGEPYMRPVAMDLLPTADGSLPHLAWVIVSSLDTVHPAEKLGVLLLDATAVRADLPRRESIVRLLDRAEIALVDGLVDLPEGARDLALDGDGRFLFIAVMSSGGDSQLTDGPSGDLERRGGILVMGVGESEQLRRLGWLNRIPTASGPLAREPVTGRVHGFLVRDPAVDVQRRVRGLAPVFVDGGMLAETVGSGTENETGPHHRWLVGTQIEASGLAVLAHGPANAHVTAWAIDATQRLRRIVDVVMEGPVIRMGGHNYLMKLGPELTPIGAPAPDSSHLSPRSTGELLAPWVAQVVGHAAAMPIQAGDEHAQLPGSLGLRQTGVLMAEPAAATWPTSLGFPSNAEVVEQDGFTFVLDPGKGLVVVDRQRPDVPRISRRLDLPGATRMVGFAGGLAVLAEDPSSVAASGSGALREQTIGGKISFWSKATRDYQVVVLDLLDATGAVSAAPSLTEIDRWKDDAIGPDLLAADGRIGLGWRDYTIYVAGGNGFVKLPITSPQQASRWTGPLLTGDITARHRLWATPQGRSWTDRLLRDAGRRPVFGTRVSTASYLLGWAGTGVFRGRRGQPSEILALFASRGLLYVLDARQGLVVLDTVTDPYWARVAVPVVGAEAGGRAERQSADAAATAAAPAAKDLSDGLAGPRLSLGLGDGRDSALNQGYVWLTGHPQYLSNLGRQLWTEPALLRAVEGGGMAFSGELELRGLPPTVRRAGGGNSVPVRVGVDSGGGE